MGDAAPWGCKASPALCDHQLYSCTTPLSLSLPLPRVGMMGAAPGLSSGCSPGMRKWGDAANMVLGERRCKIDPARADAIGGNQTLGNSCPCPSPSPQPKESNPSTSRWQCHGYHSEEHPGLQASPSPGQGDTSSQAAQLSLKPRGNLLSTLGATRDHPSPYWEQHSSPNPCWNHSAAPLL